MLMFNRKEYNKRYYQEHKEQYRERNRRQARKYRGEHREYSLEYGRKANHKWKRNNPEKISVYNRIQYRPELYPLDKECIFCGATEGLEHGHLDYNDEGLNYITVCSSCNKWMNIS